MSLKKYEVVISGMGGLFPGCEDMYDVEKKLYNMEEMVEEQQLWYSGILSRSCIIPKCFYLRSVTDEQACQNKPKIVRLHYENAICGILYVLY